MNRRKNQILNQYTFVALGLLCLFTYPIKTVLSSEILKNNIKDEKAREELLIVQTVSTDRKSFIISKGIKDGIAKGLEVIFANENISIVCKAQEVNRNFSLWSPVGENTIIPFEKEEVITYNTHNYGNVALNIVADVNKLTPEVNYDIVYKKFRTQNNFSLKAGLNHALFQTSTEVANDKNSNRSGYSVGIEYNYRFMPELEVSLGGRIDNEVFRQNSPRLDIPTNRLIALFAATYHLTYFSNNKNNFYLSLASGLGRSLTTVNEEKSKGLVTLLPEARFGYIIPFSLTMAMILEASIESLTSKEKFSNAKEQTTNITNAKLTIGLRF